MEPSKVLLIPEVKVKLGEFRKGERWGEFKISNSQLLTPNYPFPMPHAPFPIYYSSEASDVSGVENSLARALGTIVHPAFSNFW